MRSRTVLILLISILCLEASAQRPRAHEELYALHCATCHGADGAGGQGLSLVDDVWTHGADDGSIARVIADGLAEGAMPAYGEVLTDEQIQSLVVMIRELRDRPRFNAAKLEAAGTDGRYSSQLADFTLTEVYATDGTLWGLDFLPDGRMITSSRSGKIAITDGRTETVITGTPAVHDQGDIGMLDLRLHPDYANNGWVYVAANVDGDPHTDERRAMTEIIRARIRDGRWVDEEILFRARPEHRTIGRQRLGSRFLFHEGYLYFSIGDGGPQDQPSQDLTYPIGKTYRIHDDGRIPADNPFVDHDLPGVYEAIWTYGNRNVQGFAIQPETGLLFAAEHGPRGGDELNILKPGANYGWPRVTYGIHYNGQPISAHQQMAGVEDVVLHWTPSIAVCDIHFYTGDAFPAWRGDLLVTALGREHLRRLKFQGTQVVEQELLISDIGRIRTISVDQQGRLYLVTNQRGEPPTSRVYRMDPRPGEHLTAHQQRAQRRSMRNLTRWTGPAPSPRGP